MPLKTISTGRGLMGGGTYADKVRGFGPIAYWPLWEQNGTVARCLINPAQNGTYSSAVNTWPVGTGIGDGNTAPGFDGANDYINVTTGALVAAFNGSQGTLFHWLKMANVGVWTDGTRRDSFFTQVDGNNFVFTGRAIANNTYRFYYSAGGVVEFVNPAGLATTDWVPSAITWSKTADEVKVYWGGTQTGATQTVLGNWAGVIALALIGATTLVPANPFSGWIAHCQIYNRALTPGEIAALSVV